MARKEEETTDIGEYARSRIPGNDTRTVEDILKEANTRENAIEQTVKNMDAFGTGGRSGY